MISPSELSEKETSELPEKETKEEMSTKEMSNEGSSELSEEEIKQEIFNEGFDRQYTARKTYSMILNTVTTTTGETSDIILEWDLDGHATPSPAIYISYYPWTYRELQEDHEILVRRELLNSSMDSFMLAPFGHVGALVPKPDEKYHYFILNRDYFD
jgi:hypothetical protein